MKKVYLSILSVLALNASFSQKQHDAVHANFSTVQNVENGNNKPVYSSEKALGDVWNNTFSNPADWVINNSGQTAPGFGWDIGATESSWWTSQVINSTSDGNFAELGNGNPSLTPGTQALNVTYTLTSAVAIPVPSAQVSLSFLQFGARFNDAQEIYISTDAGTVWQKVGDNSDIPALTASSGAALTNPTLKSINLANYIGSATSILVRFSWTTAFPASASNANVWVAYAWMIDDVNITTNPTDDLKQNGVLWGTDGPFGVLPYYKVPVSQISPIEFGGIITNNGINNQTDVLFNATATGYAGVSAATTINSAVLDTVWVANPLTPVTTLGSTTVSFNTSMTATDVNPADNALAAPITFEITEFEYARDSGPKTGTSDNGTEPFEVGNIFDIFETATLFSADVFLDNTTTTGTLIYAALYDASGADFVEVARTDDRIVASTDKNKKLALEFEGGVELTAETSYLLVVGSAGGTAPNDLVVQTAGTSEAQTSFFYDGSAAAEWLYTTSTPKVRMNFGDASGIKELTNTVGLAIYPNPAAAQTSISFNLKEEAKVSVSIVDVTGKSVYANELGAIASGAHKVNVNTDTLSNGVYMVNVTSNGSVSTQKLVVRK
jgi:hypothetical protein